MKMEHISLVLLLLFSVLCSCGSDRIKELENRVGRLEDSAAYHEDLAVIDKKIAELNTSVASVADCLSSERVAAMIQDKAVKDESLSHLTRMKVALADEKALWRREAAHMESAIADNKQDIEQVKNELQAETQTLETTLNGVKNDIMTYVDRSTKDVHVEVQSSIVQKIDEMKTYVDSSFQTKARWRHEASAMETAIADNKQDIEQAKSEVQNHVQMTANELRAEAQTLETTLNSVKDDITAYVDLSTRDVKNDVQNSVVEKIDEMKTYVDSSFQTKALWRREAAVMETAIADNRQVIEKLKNELQAETQTLETTLNSVKDDMTTYVDISTKDVKVEVQSSVAQKIDEVKTYIERSIQDIQVIINKRLTFLESRLIPRTCLDLYKAGERQSGVYTIYPLLPSILQSVQVYCDMTTDEGGWTVFQRRQDGSVDFYRTWDEYASGFGNLAGEFWLGNDIISELTSNGPHELRVDLENYDGETAFAKYSNFRVSTSQDKYKLKVSGYTGDAGDSLTHHDGMAFTTRDQDNDKDPLNCAQRFSGAWWYRYCHYFNPNGLYGQWHGRRGVSWYFWKNNRDPLKKTTMMLRGRPHT